MSGVLERLRSGTGVLGDRWRALPGPVRWVTLILVAVFFFALPNIEIPGIVTTESDWPTTLFTVSYYVLLALGLNVVVGKAGLLDLGYVGFFALGAYTTALLSSPDSFLGTKWGWLPTVPVAVVVVMISGVLLGWPTLRLRGDYLAIVTLGFAEIIRVFATAKPEMRGQRGFGEIPHPPGQKSDGMPLFGVIDARPYYWLGLSLIIIVIFAVRNLDRSRVGRAWVAVREDEEAAEAMGVPTFRFKLWAFAIGAAIGSLSGVMFAGQQGFINSRNFDLFFSILVLAGVVLGGSGNITGVIVGGALIAYLPERLRGLTIAGNDAFEYRFLFFGLILILVMIFRPQGLIPNRRRAQELKDREKEVTVGE